MGETRDRAPETEEIPPTHLRRPSTTKT